MYWVLAGYSVRRHDIPSLALYHCFLSRELCSISTFLIFSANSIRCVILEFHGTGCLGKVDFIVRCVQPFYMSFGQDT